LKWLCQLRNKQALENSIAVPLNKVLMMSSDIGEMR